MKNGPVMLPLVILCSLAACSGEQSSPPVSVDVPGMPSPELALQKSLDRINGFLGSLNERIATPARSSFLLAITHDRPVVLAPAAPAVKQPPVTSAESAAEAKPIRGRNGIVWFAFGDGYPRIGCVSGQVCIVRLQLGETMTAGALSLPEKSGWAADLVQGSHGIHAGWAVALTPSPNPRRAVLRFTTNRRSYVLLLDPSEATMRSVAFTYSAGDPASQPDPPPSPLAMAQKNTPDFDYRMTGAQPTWKPMRIYREGGHTYIQFPPGGINAAPRLVVISPKSAATQPYRTVGDSYVVDLPVDDAMLIGSEAGSPVVRITHGGKA